jgi:hypothetical protein
MIDLASSLLGLCLRFKWWICYGWAVKFSHEGIKNMRQSPVSKRSKESFIIGKAKEFGPFVEDFITLSYHCSGCGKDREGLESVQRDNNDDLESLQRKIAKYVHSKPKAICDCGQKTTAKVKGDIEYFRFSEEYMKFLVLEGHIRRDGLHRKLEANIKFLDLDGVFEEVKPFDGRITRAF